MRFWEANNPGPGSAASRWNRISSRHLRKCWRNGSRARRFWRRSPETTNPGNRSRPIWCHDGGPNVVVLVQVRSRLSRVLRPSGIVICAKDHARDTERQLERFQVRGTQNRAARHPAGDNRQRGLDTLGKANYPVARLRKPDRAALRFADGPSGGLSILYPPRAVR